MIRTRITFANVTSFVALFVALSAGSYAAIAIPANSVGAKQLKAKAVTSRKLGLRAVTASKIASNAVNGAKVKNGSLTGADINLGTLGKVPAAATADTAGSASIARVKTVSAGGTVPNNNDAGTATVACDEGLVVVGGGASVSDVNNAIIDDSYPSSASAWTAHAFWDGIGGNGFTVYALCAPAASTQ